MKNLVLFFVFCIICIQTEGRTTIPHHIQECYRNNVSFHLRDLQIPLTSQILVELVRNVEHNLETVLDMRTMASSMLHSLKFDGIQRVPDMEETEGIVPIGPTAVHFNLYRLLNDYLLPGDAAMFPIDTLSTVERCTLHHLLSSSVQAWERGDEAKTCPTGISLMNSRGISYMRGRKKSRCPIERGVMWTAWGNVTPGRLLTGLVAALHPQDVQLDRLIKEFYKKNLIATSRQSKLPRDVQGNVDNMWAATIVGDLAEIVVFQSVSLENNTKLILAPSGVWNDTLIPRAYYLPDSIGTHWEMTNAEMLGGIDGFLLASKMISWSTKLSSLHMSQVIDMYYSERGIAFDPSYRACLRRKTFSGLANETVLREQVASVSRLLAYTHVASANEGILPPRDEVMMPIVDQTVNEFYKHLDELTDINFDCEPGVSSSPMEILAVLDGTFTGYHGKRLISGITQAADVSFYGSSIGFLSGSSGKWLTNVTHKVFNLFEDLYKREIERTLDWPTSFSLTKGLETVSLYLQNKTERECTDTLRSTRTTVILVLANTAIPSDRDLETSHSLISTIKAMHPGISIIYVTSEANADSYEELAKNRYMNDYVVKTNRRIEDTVAGVKQKFKEIPRQLMETHCGINSLEYEDYVSFNEETRYEIPYNFVINAKDIRVQFIGYDYGEMTICAYDKDKSEDTECKGILKEEVVEFLPKSLCQHNYACVINFKVLFKNTKFKCAEDDCRFPDQARLKIKTSWTSGSHKYQASYSTVILLLLLLILYDCI